MKYKIEITDIYKYEIEIDADNKTEAIRKAEEYYENVEDGVTGVADANSHEETRFKVV
ncbi:hypothetical protein [Zhenhengia yiwuensis]|uniref:hypothetical protein n=1 Tax=Zhenhengia yiwuensis TaxID=2763666 RepID=UPI002A765B46|nr:hypothetical protein [Zhenhengia yiwuensis]MDY3368472.1 hypothetical protein [Zhenhengia yiwuensis]